MAAATLAVFAVLGVSGAIAALGDTLFPVTSLAAGFARDFDPSANLFVRLRIWHPLIAAGAGAWVLYYALSAVSSAVGRRLSYAVLALTGGQLACGAINLLLLARWERNWFTCCWPICCGSRWCCFRRRGCGIESGAFELVAAKKSRDDSRLSSLDRPRHGYLPMTSRYRHHFRSHVAGVCTPCRCWAGAGNERVIQGRVTAGGRILAGGEPALPQVEIDFGTWKSRSPYRTRMGMDTSWLRLRVVAFEVQPVGGGQAENRRRVSVVLFRLLMRATVFLACSISAARSVCCTFAPLTGYCCC